MRLRVVEKSYTWPKGWTLFEDFGDEYGKDYILHVGDVEVARFDMREGRSRDYIADLEPSAMEKVKDEIRKCRAVLAYNHEKRVREFMEECERERQVRRVTVSNMILGEI